MSTESNTPSMRWSNPVYWSWDHRSLSRLLRWLRWEFYGEAEDGWTRATWDVPSWAGAGAGIIGTFHPTRRRLTVFNVPIWGWRGV